MSFDMLPTDNVAQVEVFKGATSVLYGAGAMGGVINVITADPADTPRTVVRLRAGVFDAPRNRLADWDGRSASFFPSAHIFHSRRIGEHFDFTAQADLMKESGYRRDEFSDRLRILLMPKYRFAKNFYIGCNTQLSIDSSATVIAYRDYPRGALLPGPGFLSMQVLYRMSFDPYLTYIGAKSQHLYQGRVYHQINEISTGQSGTATLIFNEYQFKRSFWRDKIQTVFGVNYTRNQVAAAQTFGTPYSDGIAAFAQAKFKFGGRLNVVLGARYQYETVVGSNVVGDTLRDAEGRYVKRTGAIEDDGFVVNLRRLDPERIVPLNDPLFRIGLNYRAGEATYLRASWGQALRSPSVAERYTSTFAGPLQVKPNPGILVERGWTAELGVRQLAKFGSLKGFVDAAAFTMQFKNLAEFYADTASLLRGEVAFTAQNVSNANVTGGELILGLDWKPVKDFGVLADAGVTFVNPVDFDGKKSWDGDDSTDVVAQAAIRALGQTTRLRDLVAPPIPIPA
ncbi:MAG: TonB-dependent receptor, partial [Bacteroidia bacterium]|nr:TonB-dependent receptor [Bacteroidia bacterium]